MVIDFEAIGAPTSVPAPPPAAIVSAAIPTSGQAAQAVGVVEGRPVRDERAAPIGPLGGSIQVDPELMAEMVAIEMASTPATPPPTVSGRTLPPEGSEQRMISLVATPNGHPAPPPAAIVVGTLPARQRPPSDAPTPRPVEPSAGPESAPPATAAASPGAGPESSGAEPASPGGGTQPTAARAVPSAAGETPTGATKESSPTAGDEPKAPPAEPSATKTSASTAVSAPPGAQAASPAAGSGVPVPVPASGSQPTIAGGPRNPQRRPSSEFDALERDFFAREADLYQEETGEVFDDGSHKGST
jgi:hypothetical protein